MNCPTVLSSRSACSCRRAIRLAFLLLTLPVFVQGVLGLDLLFEEDFQSGELSEHWQIGGTGDFRARVLPLSDETPLDYVLVLDDKVKDSLNSQTVAEVSFEVSGYERLEVSFDALSLGDDTQSRFLGTDGFAISVDGQTAFFDDNIRAEAEDPETEFTYKRDFRLYYAIPGFDASETYTITLTFLQFDDDPYPDDGWAFDDIRVEGDLFRGLDVSSEATFDESAGGFDLEVSLFPAPTENETLDLTLDGETRSFVYLKGVESQTFFVDYADDDFFTGDLYVSGQVGNDLYGFSYFGLNRVEDETLTLSLTLPDSLTEGEWLNENNSTLTVSPAPQNSIWVRLESDPSGKIDPYNVLIESGQTSVQFKAQAKNDSYVDGDATVSVEAVFEGFRSPPVDVTIFDDDVLNPNWSQTTFEVKEGEDLDLRWALQLGGMLREDFEFSITAEPEGVLSLPSSVTVGAGQSYADSFLVTSLQNELLDGDRSVVITATPVEGDWEPISATVDVRDDDVSAFSVSFGPYLVLGEKGEIKIEALNFSGSKLSSFNDAVSLYLLDSLGNETQISPSQVSLSGGSYTGELSLVESMAGKWLVVESEQGRTGRTVSQLKVVEPIAFTAKDFVYDPVSDRIFTSTGADGIAGYLNSVTRFNPYTGEAEAKLAVDSGLHKLVASRDGQFLYASLDNANAVQRIVVDELQLAERIETTGGGGWSDDTFNARDMLTLEGKPRDFVIIQDDVRTTYSFVGYYEDGVLLDTKAGDGTSLAAASSDAFFVFDGTNTGFGFNRYEFGEEGIQSTISKSGLITGWSNSIKSEGDWIVSSQGEVIDGSTLTLVRRFNFPSEWSDYYYGDAQIVHEIDGALGRVYYARGEELLVYDSLTYQLLLRTRISGLKGHIEELERYGSVGIAIRTSESELLFIDDESLVPRGDPVEIEVELITSVENPVLGEDFDYEVVVRNLSPNDAEMVRASLVLSSAHTVKAVESDTEIEWSHVVNGSSGVYFNLDTLDGESEVRFTVSVRTDTMSLLKAEFSASSSAPDPDSTNNLASGLKYPLYELEFGEWRTLHLGAVLTRWLPERGILLVATDDDEDNELRNHLLGVVPETGELVGAIDLGAAVSAFDCSANEKLAYVGFRSESVMRKVDLDTWKLLDTVYLEWGGGYYNTISAVDILVLDQYEDAFAVTSSSSGVAVFKNGVALDNATGTYNGSLVEPSTDPGVVYAFNTAHTGFEFFKIAISDTGTEVLSSKGGLMSGFSQTMKSEGDRVFASSGTVVRGDLMAVESTFGIADVRDDSSYRHDSKWDVEPELSRQRVYFNDAHSLYAFDSKSKLLVRSERLVDLSGYYDGGIQTIERWGESGFAVTLSDGQLLVGETSMVPTEAPFDVDLQVDQDGAVLVVDELPVRISGRAFAGQGIDYVRVNGQDAVTSDGYATWEIELDSVPDGEGTISVVAADKQATPVLKEIQIRSSYYIEDDDDFDGMNDDWELSMFPGKTLEEILPDADGDFDGFSNLHEFIFGSDPKTRDRGLLTVFRQYVVGEMLVIIEVRRHLDARYHFSLEYSHNGSDWSPVETEADLGVTDGMYQDISYELLLDAEEFESILFRLKYQRR